MDTNVPIVANETDRARIQCANACAQALLRITRAGTLVIDDRLGILSQYRTYLSYSGQPGVGDLFFKWLTDHLWEPELVCQVPITRRAGSSEDDLEFPTDPDLAGFHDDDRIFVAVALNHRSRPPILNATDRDWWDYRHALRRNGVRVEFLCPDQFQVASG